MSDPIEQACQYVAMVVGTVSNYGSVPPKWGKFWKVEQVRVMLDKALEDEEQGSSQNIGDLPQGDPLRETPKKRAEIYVTAILQGKIRKYFTTPKRIAKLQEFLDKTPEGKPRDGGPGLAIVAINATLSAERVKSERQAKRVLLLNQPMGDDGNEEVGDLIDDPVLDTSVGAGDDRHWEIYESIEQAEELGLSKGDIDTLSVFWEESTNPDWDAIATRLGVGSVKAARTKVNRARARLLAIVESLPDGDRYADTVDAIKDAYSQRPQKEQLPSVRSILLLHDVENRHFLKEPNRQGWINLPCPWHDASGQSSAGYNAEIDRFKCWNDRCYMFNNGNPISPAQMLARLDWT